MENKHEGITHCPIPESDADRCELLYKLYNAVQYTEAPDVSAPWIYQERTRERLRCIVDFAIYLGGDSLESLIHCMQRIVFSYKIAGTDSAPFSFLFQGRGLYGGVIFHHQSKDWCMHT